MGELLHIQQSEQLYRKIVKKEEKDETIGKQNNQKALPSDVAELGGGCTSYLFARASANPALPLTALMHIPVLPPPIQPNSTQRHKNGHLRGRKVMRC